MLNLVYMISIQGRERCLDDFWKCTFNIGMHSDTHEPVSFEVGILLETIKFYSLGSVWMTLTSQGHRLARNLCSFLICLTRSEMTFTVCSWPLTWKTRTRTDTIRQVIDQ